MANCLLCVLALNLALPNKNAQPYHPRVPESKTNHEMSEAEGAATKPARFSLHSLSAAFARLTGASRPGSPSDGAETSEKSAAASESVDNEALLPRMIVEGMLFVGHADGRPLTSREMAVHIRDVSPREIETLIDELNTLYQQTGTSYRIASEGQGFRFVLDDKCDGVRQRFFGRVREAKLTPTAIEVLSVVAYRQPIHAEDVTRLRGGRSHALLNQLVRRGLLRLERPHNSPRKPLYHTTDRFNALFHISSPRDLPCSEDLDDC